MRERCPGKGAFLGEEAVLADSGRAGEKGDFFSILLGGEFDESQGVEILVESFMVHQFSMGAGLHETSFVEDKDAIGSLDGRQAMGNHKGSSAFHESLQCLLDESFRLTVEGRGGFIQQQDPWIFHDGSGDGDALSLTA